MVTVLLWNPPFELYKTKITHSHKKDQVKTEVIRIRTANKSACLLKELFSQLASHMHYEKQIGIFVPTGAVHSIGLSTYTKLICENNQFLQSIVTILAGYFQHPTLNIPFLTKANTDIDQSMLYDVISEQPWCLSMEKTIIKTKVLSLLYKRPAQTSACMD